MTSSTARAAKKTAVKAAAAGSVIVLGGSLATVVGADSHPATTAADHVRGAQLIKVCLIGDRTGGVQRLAAIDWWRWRRHPARQRRQTPDLPVAQAARARTAAAGKSGVGV